MPHYDQTFVGQEFPLDLDMIERMGSRAGQAP